MYNQIVRRNMKKILYSLLAFVIVLLSSCSNDDIEITTVGKKYKLAYNLSIQGVYDEFEITPNVREILRDHSWAIGVSTYVYDKDGKLVDSKFTHQYTFNSIREDFTDLQEGSYTIVSIETLVDPDDEFEADNWSVEGEEMLSTLQIEQVYSEVRYPFVLGVCTNNIVLSGDQTLNATPKAIGSLLHLTYLNFNKSTYADVGLGTNDIISAYRLDPTLSHADRYVINNTSTGYFNLRAKRGIDGDNTITLTRYVLEASIDWKFYYKLKENAGTETWTYWESNTGTTVLEDGKTYYGGLSFVGLNTPCKSYLGDKEGFNSWYLALPGGSASLVPDLYLTWGGSVANVQAAMNGYTMTLGEAGHAVQTNTGVYEINYAGKGKESKISYAFTSETKGLFEIDVLYDKASVTSKEILAYLDANYNFVIESDSVYMYSSLEQNMYVLFFEAEGMWYIGFVDIDYIDATSTKLNMASKKLLKMHADALLKAI